MARTQAERRYETLHKLHEATIACIVSQGFSRLTTIEIARTAGVSQGALFRYYPTKTAAVVGATQHLFTKVMSDFDRLVDQSEKPSLERLIDDLWLWFASADFLAVSRLFAESSADSELREAILPILGQHRSNIDALMLRLFPSEGEAMLRTAGHAIIYLMQGMAAERHLVKDDVTERAILNTVRQFAAMINPTFNDKTTRGVPWNK